MSFMQAEIEQGDWSLVLEHHEGPYTDLWLPTDMVEDWNTVEDHKPDGFGARLSAPGYLDCTDWTVFETVAEAAQYLLDTYFDEPCQDMDADQLAETLALAELAGDAEAIEACRCETSDRNREVIS